MTTRLSDAVVHLELRSDNLARACAFYSQLFRWPCESVRTSAGDYLVLGLGGRIDGGVVEHAYGRPFWLPYVEVTDIEETAERGCSLGASLLLPPREGPAGWRSVLEAPAGGTIALWQPKR